MIDSVCVCGAGTMGSGIAFVTAQAGLNTIQYDINKEMLEKSKQAIQGNLQYLLNKQKITTEEAARIFNRVSFTSNPRACIANLVIEAIYEDLEAKVALINQMADINEPGTIFTSNTSSISITSIQEKTRYPSELAGMHFFNPAPAMKLVEIVKGKHTSYDVVNLLHQLCVRLGKTAVHCADSPGFIVNRVARPFYLEALKLLETHAASHEAIDRIMEASGFKMGPFKLMDLIGIDINYSVSNIVWEALDNPARLEPSSIQKNMVEAGKLGRKTGVGFYLY